MKTMPDVTTHMAPHSAGSLAKVGMTDIEIPVRIFDAKYGMMLIPGNADAFVSLDNPRSKGIHMSRIFLELSSAMESKFFSDELLKEVLEQFIKSHSSLSKNAFLEVRYQMPVQRKALLSNNTGWRNYPIKWKVKLDPDGFSAYLDLQIAYSSTCPCSAALSRQIIQENFLKTFSADRPLEYEAVTQWLGTEQGISATPHGQRSHANISLKLSPGGINVLKLIDMVELALGTPVQTAVKREDEQEFARLNAANLMFAEDAARKIASMLQTLAEVQDFRAEVIHYESLHAHNASAIAVKGVNGGFKE